MECLWTVASRRCSGLLLCPCTLWAACLGPSWCGLWSTIVAGTWQWCLTSFTNSLLGSDKTRPTGHSSLPSPSGAWRCHTHLDCEADGPVISCWTQQYVLSPMRRRIYMVSAWSRPGCTLGTEPGREQWWKSWAGMWDQTQLLLLRFPEKLHFFLEAFIPCRRKWDNHHFPFY